MSASISSAKAKSSKRDQKPPYAPSTKMNFWRVENWTQGGNFTGFRIVRGNADTLEVAKDGGFVVNIFAAPDDPKSRSSCRDKATAMCTALNKEINEEKLETRLAKNKSDED